jgi:hypothetical protein
MNQISLEFDDTYELVTDMNNHIKNKIKKIQYIVNNYDISRSNKKDKSDISVILYNLIATSVVLKTLKKSLIKGNTDFEDDSLDPKNLTNEQLENYIKIINVDKSDKEVIDKENKPGIAKDDIAKDIRFVTDYGAEQEDLFNF